MAKIGRCAFSALSCDNLSSTDYDYSAYPTTHHSYFGGYKWGGVIPFSTEGATKCLTGTISNGTPLPSEPPLPTIVSDPDPKDPRGWMYCYESGFYMPIVNDSYYALFSDSLIGALSNESNCEQQQGAWAPAVAVNQASFLLDTTTSYISKTTSQKAKDSPTSSKKEPGPSVTVDPFEPKPPSPPDDAEGSSPPDQNATPSLPSDPYSDQPEDPQTSPNQDPPKAEPATLPPADQNGEPSDQGGGTGGTGNGDSQNTQTPPAGNGGEADDNAGSQGAGSSPIDSSGKPGDQGSSQNTSPQAPAPNADHPQNNDTPPSGGDSNEDSGRSGQSAKNDPVGVINSLIQEVGQQRGSDQAAAGFLGSATVAPAALENPGNSKATQQPAAIPVGSTTITANAAGEYMVGAQTLQPGGPAREKNGVTYSLDQSRGALVVNGASTYPVPHINAGQSIAATLTLGDATAILNSASEYIVGGQTLKPGGPAITLSGTPVSLAQGATAVVIGSQTSILAKPNVDQDAPATITLNGAIATLNSASEYVVGGQILRPGAPAITLSGTSISLAPGGTAVVIGADTSLLVKQTAVGDLPSMITLGGAAATLNSASEYVVGDQTLKPGAPAITLSGTPMSLAPGGTAIVIGTETSVLVKTSAVGDYVWAGIAGVISAAKASMDAAQTNRPGSNAASDVVISSTVSDGRVTVITVPGSVQTSANPNGGSLTASDDESPASSPTAGDSSDASSPASASRPVAETYITAALLLLSIALM